MGDGRLDRAAGAGPEADALTTSRRGFLRLAGAAAAFTALGQLRVVAPGARALPADAGPAFFDPWETEVLTQIMERVVETGLPDAPRVRDTRAVATVDALCHTLPPGVSGQLPLALRLFEYGPLLFDLQFSRFTRMSDEQKDASLEAWMTSRLSVRRMAFTGVRNLCFFGYYSQDETWPLIGYAGPLIGRAGSQPA
ncbi:MAG: hypothetical protein V3U03_14750 [Myxococcota bacterium]